MIDLELYIADFYPKFPRKDPWRIINNLSPLITKAIGRLNSEYEINDGIAVHRTAVVSSSAILKAPIIIGKHCYIGSHACLRNGVFLFENVKVGIGVEIKTSIIFNHSSIAHFNFIGDSIIGNNVNFEAGSITANHYNERENKQIFVKYNEEIINTEVDKFGSVIGDFCKIGANAVLSPGTLLKPGSIVKRLELIEQIE